MLLSSTLTSVIQALIFSLPPFLTYLAVTRGVKGFPRYVGLFLPERRSFASVAGLLAFIVPLTLAQVRFLPLLNEGMKGPTTNLALAARVLSEGPWTPAAAALLVQGMIQNGLAEEILFRGFIAKRLIARLGFAAGNAAQAAVFGALHVLLFLALGVRLPVGYLIYILLWPSCFGWLLGWINERAGNGSIAPSVVAHGVGDVLAALLLARAMG